MVRRYRSAFTLVELLVVIAIIGMLMGLVLPAVNSAREKTRTGICLSNMRQISLAVTQYETGSVSGKFPGYKSYLALNDRTPYKARTPSPYPSSQQGQQVAVSWLYELFPYIDLKPVQDAWKVPMSGGGSSGGGSTAGGSTASQAGGGSTMTSVYPYIELVVCPSDPPASFDRAPISIVVNTGMRDGTTPGQRDYRANGVFHDHYTDNPQNPTAQGSGPQQKRYEQVTSAFISQRGDGLQSTLLLSENTEAGSYLDTDERFLGFTWATPTSSVDFSQTPPSAQPPTNFRFINQDKFHIASMIEDPSFSSSGGGGSSGGGSTAGGSTASSSGGSGGSYEDDGGQFFYYARPASNHPNGVNVIFCDGHGVFLSERIDYYVYVLMMTPQGSQVIDPKTGSKISQPGFNSTTQGPPIFDPAWIQR